MGPTGMCTTGFITQLYVQSSVLFWIPTAGGQRPADRLMQASWKTHVDHDAAARLQQRNLFSRYSIDHGEAVMVAEAQGV